MYKLTNKKCFSSLEEFNTWQLDNCSKCKKCVRYNKERNTMGAYICAIQRDIEMQISDSRPVTERTYNITRSSSCPLLREKKVLSNVEKIGKDCKPEVTKDDEHKSISEAPAFYRPIKRPQPSPLYARPSKPKSLLGISVKKMIEKQDEQRNCVFNNIPSEATNIANNVTFSSLCRNEFANIAIRDAISAARSHKKLFKQKFKQDINGLSKEVAKYDTIVARATQGNESLLDYADGYTEYFCNKAKRFKEVIYSQILNALLPFEVKYPDVVARFHTASILLQFATKRLETEIATFKNKSVNIMTLDFLVMRSSYFYLNLVLEDLNNMFFSEIDLKLNENENVCAAVDSFVNYVGNFMNVKNAMTEYDDKLYEETNGEFRID